MAKRSSKSGRKTRSRRAGGAQQGVLPALSSLTELPTFGELSAGERQREAFLAAQVRAGQAGENADELVMGCVVRLDRGYPAVCSEGETFRAEFATRLTKGGLAGQENSRVAVGDWVCARLPEGHEMGLIEEILPRESDIARWRGKARGEKQTLAANVDVVLVVQQLGEREVSCERIARSAVIARDCGADVAVVLTKADRASDAVLARDVAAVREILGEGCHLALTSSAARGDEATRVRRAADELAAMRRKQEQAESRSISELDFAGGDSHAARLGRELAEAKSKCAELSSAIAEQNGFLAAMGDPMVLASEISRLQDEHEELSNEYDAISLAVQTLKAADADIQSRFSPELGRLAAHFGEKVAGLHSSLRIAERFAQWRRIRDGEARVVVGTRSAVFAPVRNLGLLILDEEQEHMISYIPY